MNMFLKSAITISSALMLMNHAAAGQNETAGAAPKNESSTVVKVENAVERGAKAAATGVEHGLNAAGKGIERGGKAAGRGINHGVQATKKAVGRVVDKIDKQPASSSAKTDK